MNVPLEKLMSEAVRFETVSDPDDPDFMADAFSAFRNWISDRFPQVANHEVQDAPSGGILWRIDGQDDSLAPGLFIAHHDVVPAPEETVASWTSPPFAGEIADGHVWGRGTLDNKSNLVTLLSALEAILHESLPFARTLYVYSGSDEEVMGLRGAKRASDWFAQNDIKFDFVLDEGMTVTQGLVPGLNCPVAMIGLAEWGYASTTLAVSREAEGHSSMPPAESLVSELGRITRRLEARAFPGNLGPLTKRMLKSLAPHASGSVALLYRFPTVFAPLIRFAFARTDATRAQLGTSLAVTRLSGGNRENAVPARVEARLNIRTAPGESTDTAMARLKALGGDRVTLSPPELQIEASKIADQSGGAWDAICASINDTFPGAAIAPSLFTGHADAIWFEPVARNVYRFSPLFLTPGDPERFHGIDERISIDDLNRMCAFYGALIARAFGI